MGRMGNGYGSEFHLLRFMGRHRHYLDDLVLNLVRAKSIDWIDFPFDKSTPSKDAEWKGISFLKANSRLERAWEDFWPTGRGIHNWDAIAKLDFGSSSEEWLLVEAKANLEEIKSSCGARDGLAKIKTAFADVKSALGVVSDRDWLSPYYQYCNRVAALHFLNANGVRSHLLFIYFCGDLWKRSGAQPTCPKTESDWQPALRDQAQHVGLPPRHPLAERIHSLYPPVCVSSDPKETSKLSVTR